VTIGGSRVSPTIALREIKETRYRLRVLRKCGFLSSAQDPVIEESVELVKILATLVNRHPDGKYAPLDSTPNSQELVAAQPVSSSRGLCMVAAGPRGSEPAAKSPRREYREYMARLDFRDFEIRDGVETRLNGKLDSAAPEGPFRRIVSHLEKPLARVEAIYA
jgi:hypothetical protein